MICLPDSLCSCCICNSSFQDVVISLFPKRSQEVLNLLVTEERYWTLFYMPLYTFLQNLLNVLVQIANKWDYKKYNFCCKFQHKKSQNQSSRDCALCMESIQQPLSRYTASVSLSRLRVPWLINCTKPLVSNHSITSAAFLWLRLGSGFGTTERAEKWRDQSSWASLLNLLKIGRSEMILDCGGHILINIIPMSFCNYPRVFQWVRMRVFSVIVKWRVERHVYVVTTGKVWVGNYIP
jgi:hypothetical protein